VGCSTSGLRRAGASRDTPDYDFARALATEHAALEQVLLLAAAASLTAAEPPVAHGRAAANTVEDGNPTAPSKQAVQLTAEAHERTFYGGPMGRDDVTVGWDEGRWLNTPAAVERAGQDLVVTAVEGSDFWRTTAYGFVHDDGHALLQPFPSGQAVEVSFLLDYDQQFDQAGVFIRASEMTWVKAGVEISDGIAQIGAVVTHGVSDWSVAPVPNWINSPVTVRVSRDDEAVIVRAKGGDDPWQLVRVAPWPDDAHTSAGPYCCSPTRSGLHVRFTSWMSGNADPALHSSTA
jgi:regulation of enolase protein 1 (concanavalin A-like superfamily)